MTVWSVSPELEIFVSAEPEPSFLFGERFIERALSRDLISRNTKTKLKDFGDLPVKAYQIKLPNQSPSNSIPLGNLSDLNGPDDDIDFAQLWHELVHPTDRPRLAEIYRKIRSDQTTQWKLRFRWLANNTTILHVGSYDSEQRVVQGVLIDVTETKEVRPDHMESEKMTAMGLMAVGVAHDLNNLLCAILSFAGFAQDEVPKESQSWKDMGEVIKAAERAESLTKQLLSFSRIEQSSVSVKVDLRQRLSELSTILARLLGDRIRLRVAPSTSPVVVSVDPVQFDQVVINLALNARDAMLPEGGKLDITLEPDESDRGTVLLKIADSGRGMDAETMDRIFEPFFTTKPSGEGTGFGLATCAAIVEKVGGRIEVKSTPGEGTVFSVHWPLIGDASE